MIRKLSKISQVSMVLLVCLGLLGGQRVIVSADTLTVTKFTDSNDGSCGADCSLREAIIAANSTSGEDVILLQAGTYTLTLDGLDDLAAVGDLDVREPLTITGTGADVTIIDGDAINDGVFLVLYADNVTFSQLSVRNGTAPTGSGIGCDHTTTLTLNDVIVSHNLGGNYGGGLSSFSCNLTINRSQISNNSVVSGGGGMYVHDSEVEINQSVKP